MKWYHYQPSESYEYEKKRFILKKESHVRNKQHLESFEFRMSLLRQKKFRKIKIPYFTYCINGSIITYEIEFIKGTQLKIENVHEYYNIIESDLIFTEENYGFTDFSLENFIVQLHTGELYFVDFEDWCSCNDLDRKKRWDEQRQKDIEQKLNKPYFWK